MSEQTEQATSEAVAVDATATATRASEEVVESITASKAAESHLIAPDHEAPKPDAPKVEPEAPKVEAASPIAEIPEAEPVKAEASNVEPQKIEATKTEMSKIEAHKIAVPEPEHPASSNILIMPPGGRSWQSEAPGPQPEAGPTPAGKRRMSAMAAVIALAAISGALGGALATAGVMHFSGNAGSDAKATAESAASVASAVSANQALEVAVARVEADVAALKTNVEHSSKLASGQLNKTTERLDKLEKAQAEPAAKLAKLSETVDKLRVAQAAAPQPVAAKETTGSITPSTTTANAAVANQPKSDVGRLPQVQGWVLRDVANGGALIEGRQGIYEVYAGDPVPGLGRIDAIRRQDGRWVVVTSKGLIVAR